MTWGAALKGTPYPYRSNSLNLFRLIFAGTVLVAHSFYTSGQGAGPHIRGENLGGWAVAGFFVVSGFLITRSRLRTSAGDYLLHRIVRIFPAFLVCLVVTAAVFGPLAMMIQSGSLKGYITEPVTPLQFVWSNVTLYMNEYTIGGTLSTLPYPSVWNGSLWTLYYEFLCYILVWLLAAFAWFRRSILPALVLFVASTAGYAAESAFVRLGLDGSFVLFLKLCPYFLGGACIHFVIQKFGINRWLGFFSLLVAAVLIISIPRWGGQASAPFLAYGLLWLATVIPQPQWIARNDVSYGFYIYAWPVQQILALTGLGVAGGAPAFWLYNVVAAVITVGLAWLSWVWVERPSMRRIRRASTVPQRTSGRE